MHSKVIIASLVFGLSIGFAAIGNRSVSVFKPKEDETTFKLQKQETDPTAKTAARVPVIQDGGGGGGSHTHVYNYSYDYRNDTHHYANCACGAATSYQEHVFDSFYPNGHGHNDMIHCALCDSNIWMTAMQLDNEYTDSFGSYDGTWYYFCPVTSGTYVFETTGSYDTYGELYLGNYPTTRTTYNDDGGVNRNFKITRYLTAYQNVFLRVRGYGWGAATYSISVTEAHVHNYSQTVQYDANYHKLVCSCGDYILQAHAYNTPFTSNHSAHTMECVCGRRIVEAHTFDNYLPYGHGHNDLIHCARCQANVECYRMEENAVYNHSIAYEDANWYLFIPETSGTYIFETTGSYDTYADLFVGTYPTSITHFNDDDGAGNNFRLSYYLEAGVNAFLRVREYDWESANYKISVTKEVPAPQPNPTRRWTIMMYVCGSTLESGSVTNTTGNITDAIWNILNVPNKPSDVNIIIEAGGCTSWCNGIIPDNEISRYYVNNGQLCVDPTGVQYDRYASMGAESTFESFLRWGLTYYPAQKTGVILMNHGGAMYGVCFDSVHNDDSLSNAETNQAFRNVLGDNPTQKLEFIQYDACLMALQDVVRYNSKYFNYMVASEDEITENMVSGVSAQWLAGLYAGQSTTTFLETMIDEFIPNSCGWEQTSTLFNLSKMTDYYNDFESFASALSSTIRNSSDLSSLYDILENSYIPWCPWGGSHDKYCVADCYWFLEHLRQDWYASSYIDSYIVALLEYFPEEYEIDWTNSFLHSEARSDSLVKYHAASFGRNGTNPITHGLSIYYGYYDFDNEMPFPQAESDFNNWRNIFID